MDYLIASRIPPGLELWSTRTDPETGGHLGVILGPSWGHLGASRALLGPCWDHLGTILGPSWGHLEASWAFMGPSWGHPGAILEPLRESLRSARACTRFCKRPRSHSSGSLVGLRCCVHVRAQKLARRLRMHVLLIPIEGKSGRGRREVRERSGRHVWPTMAPGAPRARGTIFKQNTYTPTYAGL